MLNVPKISIIVPVWNRQDLIERCLDSILNQTVKPYEVIVVDNGSTDRTFEKVDHWMQKNSEKGIRFKLLSEPKSGACQARQKGLENSEGEFINFFDSDDEMRPALLETAINKIQENPKSHIICWSCRINLLDGSKKIPTVINKNLLESHLVHALLRPQGYIVRKDFLINAGGWSKPIKVWNDYELGLRLLLKEPSIIFVNQQLAEIYSQTESITGKNFSSKHGEWEKTLNEMEKVVDSSNHSQKKKIKKILDYRRVILAAHYYREGKIKEGKDLYRKTIKNKLFGEKLYLKFSYNFTRYGFRGAWRIVRFFY
ncbi:MAG: glycosyltransferase family 2 protein [Muribaculaceae bacterium]|nr:glycosyltransferase family 2 protein [Muribaculaceae bacterium]